MKKNEITIIFLQIVVAFILGIFGNSVADFVKLDPIILILVIVVLILIALFLTLYQNKVTISFNFAKVRDIFFSKISSIFPLGIILGLIIEFIVVDILCRYYQEHNNIPYIRIALHTIENDYAGSGFFGVHIDEIISYVIAVFLLYFTRKYINDNVLFLTYGIGLSMGISSMILYINRDTDDEMYTLLGSLLFISIAISIVNNTNSFIRKLIAELNRNRTDST